MKDLATHFKGIGEVRGYEFSQISKTDQGYLYEVHHPVYNTRHWEVVRKTINMRFDCISYPKSNSFGLWAWCFNRFDDARQRLAEL